jgi:hypothetical protein
MFVLSTIIFHYQTAYTYSVYFDQLCMHYHIILSEKNTVYTYTVHWLRPHPSCCSTEHYNPFFENGWEDDGEHSSSELEEDDSVITVPLDILLSVIQVECTDRNDTSSLEIINHMDSWTQHPSEKVLMAIDSLDLNRIITAHCCSLRCLCKFYSQLIRVCHIWYLSMSQAASCQWLRMMMENQPLQHQQYHIHHQVHSSLCLLHKGSYACCSECADVCSWMHTAYLRTKWPII